jgi:cytochrome P450
VVDENVEVEETIRWTTPVKEFMRTATADTAVRGVPIAEGDPNKHLHFCLGAALARIELAGQPEYSATTFVGGLKHLPVRYSLR